MLKKLAVFAAVMWKTAFGDATGLGIESTGLERWRVHTRESCQGAYVGEAVHITNFNDELRACNLARALHSHNYAEQEGGLEHLVPQDMQHIIDSV